MRPATVRRLLLPYFSQMSNRLAILVLSATLCVVDEAAYSQSFAVATTADADTAATENGGFMLNLPGIGDDFVLFADGQMVTRANGTARISAFVHRTIALDREFYLVLELSGRVAPGGPGYPPAGSPVVTLQPSAYIPTGTIDPATYVYYTNVTGTLTGLRAYDGAKLLLTNQGAMQIGPGASNKNVQNGLAANFQVTVFQQPALGTLVPTGAAQLRSTILPSLAACATHVERDVEVSSGPARSCFEIPGVGSDYILLPVGSWLEASNGTATFAGTVRRQSDHSDSWTLNLTMSGRVDPGSPTHPPAGSPLLGLLPSAYANQGGPVDPGAWHYYTQVTGSLVGSGINAGGSLQLAQQTAAQVGLGAAHGNTFVGVGANLNPSGLVQPSGRIINVTGAVRLTSNVAVRCLVPQPQVLTGIVQNVPSVTQQKLVYTGIDLGFITSAAIGPRNFGTNGRDWYNGNVRVVNQQTVEVSIPQGMPPSSYPAYFFTVGGLSNALTVNVTAPTTLTLRTENDRAVGEDQHWVFHQGPLPQFAYSLLLLSQSNLPTNAPGIIDLNIGNQGADLILYTGVLHDPATGAGTITLPGLLPGLTGLRFYAQAGVVDSTAANAFPLLTTNVWFTDYL